MGEKTEKNNEINENPPILTAREQEVMNLLLAADSTKEIAHKLGISIKTVEFHKDNLYRKLGIQSVQELFKVSLSMNVLPTQMATPEKPLIADFYDNSFYNSETIWQYKITPSIFYSDQVTAGEKYTFTFSFKSNVNFNFLDITLIDHSPEANFFMVLAPPSRQFPHAKADTEYKGSITFSAVKSATSAVPHASVLLFEINGDKTVQPTLVFTQFEFIKI